MLKEAQEDNPMKSRLSTTFVMIVASVAITVSLPALAEQPTFSSRPASYAGGSPDLPPPGDPVNMILDDGVLENNIGLNSTSSATQFLWLNRFSPTEFPIEVSRIDIWWASVGTGIVGGESIELVVYEGGADPCTGATTIVGGETRTIASLDTFDQYVLATPAAVNVGPSIDLAVIDRWVVSGVTPPVWPAAIDTTATQGRSYVASWSADPPSPPVLPSDGLCGLIDSFGFAGNWLIRGTGTVVPVELMGVSVE